MNIRQQSPLPDPPPVSTNPDPGHSPNHPPIDSSDLTSQSEAMLWREGDAAENRSEDEEGAVPSRRRRGGSIDGALEQ